MTSGRCAAGAALLTAALASACGDATPPSAVQDEPQCARVVVERIALRADPACSAASHPLARSHLPDLTLTPGLCYTTGSVRAELVDSTGRSLAVRITAYSGINGNPVAGASLAPFPAPLLDASGATRALLSVTAASVIEVRDESGAREIGALLTRDAGWAELDPATALPSFVTERLVVTGGSGALAGVVGEVLASGDEFVAGAPATGSLCGAELLDRLRGEAA